jgi:L-ascorbate metabolism protein UlaG (beta-lactamase superfamily)
MRRYHAGPPSDHFDGSRFFIPGHATDRSLRDVLRWRFKGERIPWPAIFPSPFAGQKPPKRENGLRIWLIGHASFLLQIANLNILIDPVFSDRASPLQFAGPKRINPPGIALADLPPIDAILITHNHYDHLDLASVARLWMMHHPRVIAPLGNDIIIHRAGSGIAVETLDWGESVVLGGLRVHLVPALHWSARSLGDRRKALWGGFVLEGERMVYHAGDTGYGDGSHFRAILETYGTPDVALLPIGAYAPRWFMRNQHMNPEEAVRALGDCGARQGLGYHWGTFQLADEAITEPMQRLNTALTAAGIKPVRFPAMWPGQSWSPIA